MTKNEKKANNAHNEFSRVLHDGKTVIPNDYLDLLHKVYDDMTPHFVDILRREDDFIEELPTDLLRAIHFFKLNKIWGTCCECTDSDPSKCKYTDRYDHKLGQDELDRVIGYHTRKYLSK